MEHPVLVAGATGRFAIHLTDLSDFSPLGTGEATVRLKSASSGQMSEFKAGLSRPGIYGADVTPPAPGDYEMEVSVVAGDLRDAHHIGRVEVLPALPESAGEEDGPGDEITFLKEQQWTLDFATAEAAPKRLGGNMTVPAVILPRSGGEAIIAAPVDGRLEVMAAPRPTGSRIRQGDMIARIIPDAAGMADAPMLRADLVRAEERHRLAAAERERSTRLVSAGPCRKDEPMKPRGR